VVRKWWGHSIHERMERCYPLFFEKYPDRFGKLIYQYELDPNRIYVGREKIFKSAPED
jgi:hypothetical protein